MSTNRLRLSEIVYTAGGVWAIEVKVELKGYLSRYAPTAAVNGRFSLEVPPGSTVKNVLEKVHLSENYAGLVLINGRKARMPDRLHQGDTVTIFPVVAGG